MRHDNTEREIKGQEKKAKKKQNFKNKNSPFL